MAAFKQKQEELKELIIKYLNTCKGKKCVREDIWNNLTQFAAKKFSRKHYGVSKLSSLLDGFVDIIETRGSFIYLNSQFHQDQRDVVIIDSDSDEESAFSTPSSSIFVHKGQSSVIDKHRAEYGNVDVDFLEQMISVLQSLNGKCSIEQFRDRYESTYGPLKNLEIQLQKHGSFVACYNDNLLLQPKAYQFKQMLGENPQKGVASKGSARPVPKAWGSGVASKGSVPPRPFPTDGVHNSGSSTMPSGFISFSDNKPASSSLMDSRPPGYQVQSPHQRYGLNATGPSAAPMRPHVPLPGIPLPNQMRLAAFPVMLQNMQNATQINQPHQMAAYASPALVNPPPLAAPMAAPYPSSSSMSEWPHSTPRTGPPAGTKMPDAEEVVVRPVPLARGARLTTDQVNSQVLECIEVLCEAKVHVSMERLEKLLLQKFQVRSFHELNLGRNRFDNLPAARDHNMMLGRVNSYIHNFVWGRSMCTLYELKECCRDFHPEKKDFEHLKLGPLQKMPLVYDLFEFPMDEYIPEITSLDLVEHLHRFLDINKKWTQKVSIEEYMKYLTDVYNVPKAFSLGIRVRSIPLAIQNLKKSQRDSVAARKGLMEQLRQYLNRDIEEAFIKFRANILQTSQDGSLELRRHYMNLSPEDAVRDIMGKFELLAEILMSGSQHSSKIDKMLKHFEHFTKSVLDLPIPRKLYHLSVCMSDLQVRESAQDFFEQEARRQEQEAMVQQTESTLPQHKKTPPTKVTLTEKIISYLNRFLEQGSLQLSYLGKIESKVLEDFGFSSFSEMGQARFLEFVLAEPKIKAIMEECGGTVLGSSSGSHETESIYRPCQLELLEFIRQSKDSGATQNQQVESAMCEQFHVADLRHLGHGNITRLCGASDRPGKHVSKEYYVNFEAALCGRQCPSSRSTGKVGIQGNQTKEMAMACLTNCPLLEDLMEWSHWSLVFQPQFGSLRSFIEKYGGLQDIALEGGCKTAVSDIMALEVEPGKLLKIYSQTTQEQFCAALDSEDPVASAGYLVSHIVANKGLENTPMALLSGHVKTCLLSLHARSSAFTNPMGQSGYETQHTVDLAVEFVTQMLLRLPVRICVAIANQILLEPLSSVVGSAKSKKEIIQACRLPAQKHRLELLGCLLGLPEWTLSLQSKVQFPPSRVTDVMDDEMIGQTVVDTQTDEESDSKQDSDSDDSDIDSILSDDKDNLQAVLPAEKTLEDPKKEEDECMVVSEETNSDGDKKDSDGDEEYHEVGEDESTAEKTLQLGLSDNSDKEPSTAESAEQSISGTEDDDDVEEEDEEELTREQICQRVVENIQKEEFGLGIQLDETGEKLMRKQQERQGRSLQRLSTDLYSKDTHFVLELIQNADDNSYEDDSSPAVRFVIDYSGVTVLNNELGFEEKNIKALCDVGKSTKAKHKFGYIGQKGIGFKSVFRVTGRPEVHSNGFHICFDVASGPMGYIMPHWISEDVKENEWQTRIVLPWTEEIKQQIHSHAARFNDIQPSLLLFLHRLKEITIENKVESSIMCMQRKDLPNKEVQISHSGRTDRWLVLRKILDASKVSLQVKSGAEVESTEIALAFPIKEKTTAQSQIKPAKLPVFAFLPLRSYGFRFIVQGDFDVPSSREDVDRDSSWNQWLRNEIHVLFVEALDTFKARPDLSPIKALMMYLQFIPLEGEVMDFFKPVATKILTLLRAKECMPILTEDKKNLQWKIPSKTVVTKESLVLEIVSPDLLQHHLGLYYLHPEVAAVLDDALIEALGVATVTTEHLLLVGQSISLNWDSNASSDQVMDLAKWLACVYRSLDDFQDNTPTFDKLSSFRIIPLSDGSLVSLLDVTVFMLSDGRSELNPTTNKKGKAPGQDPLLELKKDLKIVHTGLTNTNDDEVNSQVVKLLLKMGIKQMTAHDLIHSHIVPNLKSEAWKDKKREVLISYIVYIKTELERNPSVIDWPELRAVARLATNHGIKSPQTDDVHFSSAFGNKFDLRNIFPDMEWTLVDSAYLPHSRSQHDVQSWHSFLFELGVDDFLRVRKAEMCFDKSNIHETAWAAFKDLWPDSPDGYTVIDFQCEEFHKLVTANQNADKKYGQMMALYEILDGEWDGKYKRYAHTQLKSGSGHVLKEVIQSSFAIYLETLAWVPSLWRSLTIQEDNKTVSLSVTEDLRPPAEMYILDSDIEDVFGHTVKYLKVAPQKKSSFSGYLKIKFSIDVNTVQSALISWCTRSEASMDTPRMFSTTMSHILLVYKYLRDNLTNKAFQDLFHHHPAIFVPVLDCREVMDGDLLVGQMLKREEVWWSDPTELFTKYRESLALYGSPLAKRKFLQCWYPNHKDMFDRTTARVEPAPNTFELAQLLKHIATVCPATDADVLRNTLFLFSQIGSDLSKIAEVVGGVKTMDAMNAEINLPKVTKLLANSAVFPTKQGQWVSLTDNPMVVDSQELEQMFDKKPGVHFLQLEINEARKPRDRGAINVIDPESLKFVISLFDSIKPLSQCVKTEEITSSFQQCIKGQKLMHEVVGLIQRFLYFNFPTIHKQVKEKKAGDFKELVFSQVGRLEVRYELIDHPDVFEIKQEKCVFRGKNFYFHEQYVGSQTDINREITKFFSEGDEECVRDLRNFLQQLVAILEGKWDETVEQLLARQRTPIENLPSDEEVWEIPPPIIQPEPEPEVVEPTMVYGRALSGTEAEMATPGNAEGENTELKSWPPRSALFRDQSEHPKKRADGQSGMWPPPQGPNYSLASKQLPSNIKFEKVDQEEGADATSDKYQKPSSDDEDKDSVKQASHSSHGRGTARQTSDGGAKDESRRTGTGGDGRSFYRQSSTEGEGKGTPRQAQDGETKRGRGDKGGAHRPDEDNTSRGDSNQGIDAASTGKRKLTESSRDEETGDVKRLNSQEDCNELRKQSLDEGAVERQDVAGGGLPAEHANMEEGNESAVIPRYEGSREVTPSSISSAVDLRRPTKKGILQFTIPVWSESSEDVSYTELSKDHDLTIPAISLSEESPPGDVGQWGEKLVWDYLQRQRQSNSQIMEIVWANSSVETGLPYDFEIILNTESADIKQRIYVEVKTTLSWDKEVFPVSSKQIEFALQHRDHYEIYRVFGAGNRNPKLVRVDNVAEKMRSHAVRLFMVL